jgi:transcriptional regulator with XRE-family HTH domain
MALPRWQTFVRDCRKEAGLTQAQVAVKAGLSRRTVEALESGERKDPSFSTIKALTKALPIEITISNGRATHGRTDRS